MWDDHYNQQPHAPSPYDETTLPAFVPPAQPSGMTHPEHDLPPPYMPDAMQAPAGYAPQWSDAKPAYQPPPPAQPARRRPAAPPPVAVAPAYPPSVRPVSSFAPPPAATARRSAHSRRHLPRFHIAHVLLLAGLGAMYIALGQAWGAANDGSVIFIRDFASPRLAQAGVDVGSSATQIAGGIVLLAAVLSGAMVLVNLLVTLLNKAFGLIGLSGCATLAFFPVLWGLSLLLFVLLLAGAGFGGLGALSQLPVVQNYGFANVRITAPSLGFYLWWAGLIAVFLGMLGELALRRR